MTTRVTRTRPSQQLTLKDRLSHLTFLDACKLLGPEGKRLIQQSANLWDFKPDEHVFLGDDLFRLQFPGEFAAGRPVVVTITLMAEARQRLHWNCTHCQGAANMSAQRFHSCWKKKCDWAWPNRPSPAWPSRVCRKMRWWLRHLPSAWSGPGPRR